MVVEVLREEEVFVFFVAVGFDVKCVCFGTTGKGHGLRFGILFRKDGGDGCFTKLQLRLYTKQTLTTLYKVAADGKIYITKFDKFDDFVFFAFVFQLKLIFKVKGCPCVVIHGVRNLVAYFGNNVHLYVFVKVEVGYFSLTNIQGGVISSVVQNTKF